MNRPDPSLANVVIRASAGTGKTFQLSNRFLRLALDGAPLDSILATTFTRKAAGEILDRILVRLADAAADEEGLAKLRKELERPALARAQCLDVLQSMVRQLHRFRVGTLDSVFVQMARSFSLELGLPPGWQIADEATDRRLRAEAIAEMLDKESSGDTLRLMHLLSKGEAARSVAQQIFDLVGDLYQIHGDSPAEAWSSLPRRKPLPPEKVAAAVAALAEVALPPGKRYSDVRAADLARAEATQWEAFLSSGLPKAILANGATYYSKPIPDEVVAAYTPLVEHAKAEVVGAIANQTEATREMLAHFERAYVRRQASERLLRFDDVTRRLGEAAGRHSIDQMVYRLDAHLVHLLLDEFQDTSPGQWRVLRPFAQRIVGRPGHTFLCVGDVKQAIYGWRGGVAEILEAIADELTPLEAAQLNQSFRSSPVVIDLVNRVFERLAENEALAKHPPAARAWAARFARHSTARTELAGYCRLETAPSALEGQRQDDVTLDFAARRVAELRAAAPGRSIGVLVRRNRSVARLIYRLRQQGVPASEEGGNPLTDSPAVELVLSALRLADHPGDTAARFHVARSPLAEALGLGDYADGAAAWRVSAEIRRRLLDDGFGPTIHRWTATLAPHCDRRDLDRLVQLVEMAHGYQSRAATRADDFVELVRQQRVDDPSTSDVRVMTIHQAKGLQFDMVVLPELDCLLLGQSPRLVVGRRRATEPVERVCRYVGEKLRPVLPRAMAQMFETDCRQRVEESLCLLYVSLTRAVHALHMIIAPSRPNERQLRTSAGCVLRAALGASQPVGPETVVYQDGDPAWAQQDPIRTQPDPTRAATVRERSVPSDTVVPLPHGRGSDLSPGERSAASDAVVPLPHGRGSDLSPGPRPIEIALAPPQRRPRRGLDRRSPSQLEGGPRVDLARRIQMETSQSLARGTVMHEWFEQIGWLEDGVPSDEQLWTLARRHTGDEATVRGWMADFRAALARSGVQDVLRRAAYDRDGVEPRLWRERPFAVRQDDILLTGSIDRLVVSYQAGKPLAADILDFKTDRLASNDPAALAARVEFYRPQMTAYATAVASMFALPPEIVSSRLIFIDSGVVCPV